MGDRLAKVECSAVKVPEISLREVCPRKIQLIELWSNSVGRFLSWLCPCYLFSHETVDIPVVISQLSRILKVAKDLLAKVTQFTSERDLASIDFSDVNLAWLSDYILWFYVLFRRLVIGVKWTVHTDIPVPYAHQPLITILRVLFVKLINCFLLYRYFINTFAGDYLWCVYLDIDF